MVMDTSGCLIAGSHNRNEFIFINEDIGRSKPVQELKGQTCRICGDRIETVNKDGFVKRKIVIEGDEPFVACNECAFPICMTSYRYERREGLLVCPHCKTRYKRHKGCPRVEGDEEEEDVDDLEKEFASDDDDEGDAHDDAKTMHYDGPNVTGSNDREVPVRSLKKIPKDVLLLSYHQEDSEIPPDHHALIIPSILRCTSRVHPVASPVSSKFKPDRWILRKTWLCMVMEVWHGRIELSIGRWLSTKVEMVGTLMEMDKIILICPRKHLVVPISLLLS